MDLIADRFNVTAYQIRRWNGLKSSKLTPGRTLHLYVEDKPPSLATSHSRPAAKSKHPATRAATVRKKPAVAANRTVPAAALRTP